MCSQANKPRTKRQEAMMARRQLQRQQERQVRRLHLSDASPGPSPIPTPAQKARRPVFPSPVRTPPDAGYLLACCLASSNQVLFN